MRLLVGAIVVLELAHCVFLNAQEIKNIDLTAISQRTEPTLRKKFGAEYEEYCRNVRRWVGYRMRTTAGAPAFLKRMRFSWC